MKKYHYTQEEHDGPLSGFRKTCPVCRKEFRSTSGWVYRIGHKGNHKQVYFCGWNCKREYERRQELKKEERQERMVRRNAEQVQRMWGGGRLDPDGGGRTEDAGGR